LVSRYALHLQTFHTSNIHQADPILCQQCNIHITPKIYLTKLALTNHYYNYHHKPLFTTNSAISKRLLVSKRDLQAPPDWANALQFIHSKLAPYPASCSCHSGIKANAHATHLSNSTDLFIDIITACNEASCTFMGPSDLPEWETQDNVFYWLLFHAKFLVFCPHVNQSEHTNDCIQRCLDLLYAGRIQELWTEATKVTSRLPNSKPPAPTTTNSVNKAAQAAADVDNYSTCYSCITSDCSIATLTQQDVNGNVLPLYPSPLPPLHHDQPPPVYYTTNPPDPTKTILPLPGDLIKSIQQTPRGKANGFTMTA
jgi:hypothetical protein